MSECQYCHKKIQHRNICPVLRKIQTKEYEAAAKQKAIEEKIIYQKLQADINSLESTQPHIVKYIRKLEEEIKELEDSIEHEKEIKMRSSFDYEEY